MGRRPEIDFQNNLKYHALHESYPSIWTAYTGTICYTKPPMSFSNQKKKKKEMKLTAAQRDWDTLH